MVIWRPGIPVLGCFRFFFVVLTFLFLQRPRDLGEINKTRTVDYQYVRCISLYSPLLLLLFSLFSFLSFTFNVEGCWRTSAAFGVSSTTARYGIVYCLALSNEVVSLLDEESAKNQRGCISTCWTKNQHRRAVRRMLTGRKNTHQSLWHIKPTWAASISLFQYRRVG